MKRTLIFVCALGAPLAVGACATAPQSAASHSAMAAGPAAQPPAPGALRPFRLPPVEEFRLQNGLRVVTVRETSMPLVHGRVILDAGAAYEPADKNGLAVLTGSLIREGTRTHAGPQLAEQMERIGAQFGTGAGYNLTFANVTALKSVFPQAIRLAAATVLEPTFAEADFERVRNQAIAAHMQSQATVEGLAAETFSRAIFTPEAPYSRLAAGTATSLRGITRDDVVNWHRTMYTPGNAVLLLVGDITTAEARALAQEAFGAWQGTARQRPALQNPAQTVQGTRVILVDRPGSVQSAIQVGQAGIGAESDDFFRMTALSQVLGGGFNARINQNLRERHGWTYGAFTNFNALRGAGTFSIASSVRTNATDSALVETVREFQRIVREPVPPDELHGSLNNLVGSFPNSVQTVQGLAQRMQTVLIYDLPLDYYSTYRERLAAVTADQILDVGGRHVNPDGLTIVVAGDVATIEQPIRALNLGTVEVWSPDGQRLR